MSILPRTLFVHGGLHLGSSQIRGRQIAEALGCDTHPLDKFTPETARPYDVVIYVKRMPPRGVMEAVHRLGKRQVVDVLDNFSGRQLRPRARWVDCFIGASFTHAVFLQERYGRPSVMLPHHHCNPQELRIPADRLPPTLGYVGDRKHWPQTRWVVRRFDLPVVVDLEHRELVATYLKIDLGFAYRSKARRRSYNSAIKLLNYMSFGIPAVMTPESGYLEIARHGEHALYGHGKTEFAMLLARLAGDTALRRHIGEAAYEAARPFHITHVAQRYRDFLGSL